MKKKTTRPAKKGLAHSASLVILGTALLTAEQGIASEYIVPYISVSQKPLPDSREHDYSESARIVAAMNSHCSSTLRPEFQEAYLNSMLLDFDSNGYTLAITDCGQCLCASCSCAACSSDCATSCACTCAPACSTCTTTIANTCVACSSDCSAMFDCGACATPTCTTTTTTTTCAVCSTSCACDCSTFMCASICDCTCDCTCVACFSCSCALCACMDCDVI